MTPLIRIVQRKTSVLAVVFSGLSNFDFKKQDHKQFDISRLVLNVELRFGWTERQTDRQTDRHTYGETDRDRDRQADRDRHRDEDKDSQTGRQRQTDRKPLGLGVHFNKWKWEAETASRRDKIAATLRNHAVSSPSQWVCWRTPRWCTASAPLFWEFQAVRCSLFQFWYRPKHKFSPLQVLHSVLQFSSEMTCNCVSLAENQVILVICHLINFRPA